MPDRTPPSVSGPAPSAPPARVKPSWRGVSHEWAFYASLVPAVLLVRAAPTREASLAAAVYMVSLCGLLGVSALYHRIHWSPSARLWMSRLDLSMIFMLIAGTYTPIAVLSPQTPMTRAVLYAIWIAAGLGVASQFARISTPKWVNSLAYLGTGWMLVLAAPELTASLDRTATVLLGGGGLVYSLGAVVYALERPDPAPAVFGYHEIFHALVIVGAAMHYSAIALYVVPA